MTVSQLKSGKWRAQVYDPAAGRAVSVAGFRKDRVGSFDTEHKAKKAVRDAATEIGRRSGRTRMTVAELRDLWLLDGSKRWKGKTPGHYEERTKLFADPKHYGKLPVTSFSRELAVRWNSEHPGTVPTLRAMFGWAQSTGLIDETPWRAVARRKAKRQLKPGFLGGDDVEELARLAEERFGPDYGPIPAAMIVTAAWTCVRPSELFELRRKDVDWASGEIHVWRAKTSAGIDTTKKEDVRQVVAPDRVLAAIRRAMPAVTGLARQNDDETLLFTNTRGTQWSQPGWQLKWDVIRSAAGRQDLVFYDLRHFGATYLLEHGVSVEDVANQLGHRDGGKLVVSTYGHPDLKHSRDRIRRALEGSPAPARATA